VSESMVSQSGTSIADRPDVIGYLAVVAATVCWGTSGIFVKFIVADTGISALAMAFWRDMFTFVTLLVGVGLLRPAWLRVRRRDLVWMAALGSISVGTFHVLWNLGVLLNGVAVSTVQQAVMPVIVALVAWLIWREPLTPRKGMAIVLTFAGALLISGLDVLGDVRLNVSGLLVGLGIPVTYATFSLFGKQVAGRYHSLTILTYGFGFGALTLLPFQFFTPQPWPVPGSSWLWLAALVGFSTILPFSIYTFGLGRLPASVASILAMTEIPLASFYAYLLLDERLTVTQFVGAALVVSGVFLLSWRRWRNVAE
jgi:drug/metabolite transporter (DMT)-like permease